MCKPRRTASPSGRRALKVVPFVLGAFLLRLDTVSDAGVIRLRHTPVRVEAAYVKVNPPGVWLVERSDNYEIYSNGLRIENRMLSSGHPRAYLLFDPGLQRLSHEWRSEPAGIVFHTSESQLAPLEAGSNETLKRLGEGLLEHVARNRSYHFVIDRFGRVFRVVPETDYANHAGYSIWADARGIYLNLNHSFLGVGFEAQTRTETGDGSIGPAQVDAARLLVQMLLGKYDIPPSNCVTHAQVSVNPDNMRIGYHTDGSVNFPFRELGLPANYGELLPSVYAFGFRYDSLFLKSVGDQLLQGLRDSEDMLWQEASARGLAEEAYRTVLQKRYQETMTALRTLGALEEKVQ